METTIVYWDYSIWVYRGYIYWVEGSMNIRTISGGSAGLVVAALGLFLFRSLATMATAAPSAPATAPALSSTSTATASANAITLRITTTTTGTLA